MTTIAAVAPRVSVRANAEARPEATFTSNDGAKLAMGLGFGLGMVSTILGVGLARHEGTRVAGGVALGAAALLTTVGAFGLAFLEPTKPAEFWWGPSAKQ